MRKFHQFEETQVKMNPKLFIFVYLLVNVLTVIKINLILVFFLKQFFK